MQTNNPEKEIILKPSVLKLILLLLGSSAFVVAGIFFILSDLNLKIKLFAGYLNILFFGCGMILSLYKLIFRKPTLIVSSKGIYLNNLIGKQKQWVPWNDIKKIGRSQQNINVGLTSTKQMYLVIYLKDPQKYDFNKFITKEDAENIAKKFGAEYKEGIKGDVYVSAILLPPLDQVLENLRKFPVEVDEALNEM